MLAIPVLQADRAGDLLWGRALQTGRGEVGRVADQVLAGIAPDVVRIEELCVLAYVVEEMELRHLAPLEPANLVRGRGRQLGQRVIMPQEAPRGLRVCLLLQAGQEHATVLSRRRLLKEEETHLL